VNKHEEAQWYQNAASNQADRAQHLERVLYRYREIIRRDYGQAELDLIASEAEGYYVRDEQGCCVHVWG
jgi:hypothetical protein